MNFLNPLLLLGLLAASLPVIIHMINRRKAVRRPFPAMEFLLRSKKKLARRLKVRQLLLLLMRVSALLLLPLAMARPYLISDEGKTQADRLPVGVVFVVDDSASMGHEEVWAKVEDSVDERLSGLRAWDRVGLVFAGAWPDGEPLSESAAILQLSDDPDEVREALEGHRPSERATDLSAALRSASEVLANADLPRKHIVVVTDLQETGFDPGALPKGGLGATVELVDLSDGGRSNLAIVDAQYFQKTAGSRPEFEISATVKNHSDEDAAGVEVVLHIGGEQAAAGLVDVAAGETSTKSFTHQFTRKGLHRATFSLGGSPDGLAADNVRHLPIALAQKVRVLLVNGDPRSVPYQDELFYLERALRPSQRSVSTILTEVTAVEGLASHPFQDFDVVVLANVEKMPRASVAQLTDFVKGGGGLLMVVGNLVKPQVYNSIFGGLLPKPLRSIKRLAAREDPDAPVKIVRLGKVDRGHPVFKVFDLPGGETVHSVPVFSYMLLEPTPKDDSRILLSYGDGAPALLERTLDKGRVLLMTTTVDRDWTDFPIKTAFLPMMRRVVQYLARRSTSGQRGAGRAVGQRVRLEVDGGEKGRIEVRDPQGGRIVLTPESTQDNAPLSFVPRQTGHYKVVRASELPDGEEQELEELAFSVNIDPAESAIKPVAAETFLSHFNEEGASGDSAGAPALDTPEKRVGVWSILLFLVTLVLLGETILGTRRSVLVKIWNLVRGKSVELEV